MRLALGQMNATIGDFAGNGAKIESLWKEAEAARADLLLVPEMALCGYPPRDLLDRPSFQAEAARLLGELACRAGKAALLAGTILANPSKTGKPLFNAAVLLRDGRAAAVARKCLLPAYDVFDEVRHFEPAKAPTLVRLGGRRIGLGLAPISDLPKMRVYALSRHLNRRAGREVIPVSTLEKAPSAELRPGQTDQDSLPPYELLDRVLEGLVERNQTPAAAARAVGAPEALAAGIARQIDRAEYKRQQAAPGLKVSTKAFGSGRRIPIAQVSRA